MIAKIKKRDGREAPFNIEKIANAIFKAANEIGGQNYQTAMDLAERVTVYLEQEMKTSAPTVEEIQDAVEQNIDRNRTRQNRQGIYSLPGGADPDPGNGYPADENL